MLKAGAEALDIPLYQHIGGANATVLPVPGVDALNGADRYGGGQRAGDKPSHEFVCYGFDTFAEAAYAGWDVAQEWRDAVRKRFGIAATSAQQIFRQPGAGQGGPRALGPDGRGDRQARLRGQGRPADRRRGAACTTRSGDK